MESIKALSSIETGELKWEIVFHGKPRGKWRPKVTIRWYHTTGENTFNIDPVWRLPIFRLPSWKPNSCSHSEEVENAPEAPWDFYSSSCPRDSDTPYWCCKQNSCIGNKKIDFYKEFETSFYLPWRPGKANYNDILDWLVENFCKPAVEEYNRRIEEAFTSEPLDEFVIRSEDVERAKVEKEVREKKKPLRKIKVA